MSSPFPLTATDARGHTVTLPVAPRRLVSLVPSQTELLVALGLDDTAVVGVTRFCIHPAGFKERACIVGGTKQVDVDRIRALKPNLILANHEENTRAMVGALEAVAPVYVTAVGNVPDALAMIRTVGTLVGRPDRAHGLADEIEAGFDALPAFPPLRAAYLIWQDPYMTVGRDTFIHDVMRRTGLVNVFGDRTRYPEVTAEMLADARPDVLLLSSEPYPFQADHRDAFRTLLPGTTPHLVDGALFSWYGSRLRRTPAYLHKLRARLEADR